MLLVELNRSPNAEATLFIKSGRMPCIPNNKGLKHRKRPRIYHWILFKTKKKIYKNLHYAQQVKGQRIFLYSSCKHWTKSSKRLLLSIFIREFVLSNALLNAKIVWNSEYFLQSFIDKYFLKNIGNIHQLAWPHTFLRIF